jgi:UDP-N-acetylglucosamine 4-epimerase
LNQYEELNSRLRKEPKVWLVTGVAGFIGSNLLEALLRLDQRVIGLDNYATGSTNNIEQVRALVGSRKWRNFALIEGDVRDRDTCVRVCQGVDFVLHQAALGSVPGSIADPGNAHAANATGFLNMLVAARDNCVKRLVYASSCAVYGDAAGLSKVEHELGRSLSPYAATKRANELYAEAFASCYGLETIGLRYFNVFGPRQDPDGPYAAVIPKWIAAMIKNEPIHINGDGETTRDFCYVANVVQANLLAATVGDPAAINELYNVAVHARTSLNQLFAVLRDKLMPYHGYLENCAPTYLEFRPGDVRHSEGDISKAQLLLGYSPSHSVDLGLSEALDWYRRHLGSATETMAAEVTRL